MSLSESKKKKVYHSIALACLKALKNSSVSDPKKSINEVYNAIDKAFREQFSLVSEELSECQERLTLIRQLDGNEYTLKDAQEIATTNPLSKH
jgi:hypothetical protein